jgi:hypothetical protein
MAEQALDKDIEFSSRPRGDRTEADESDSLGRAAVAGRTDVLGTAGLLGLQRTVGNAGVGSLAEKGEGTSPVHEVINSAGEALDSGTQADMEARFGEDFSDVRVHTDGAADVSAQAVNARAYTAGANIVFQSGMYDPGSDDGKRMLAHELTHVVQQRNGPVEGADAGDGVKVSDPTDRFEREAEANADRVMTSSRGMGSDHRVSKRSADRAQQGEVVQRDAGKASQADIDAVRRLKGKQYPDLHVPVLDTIRQATDAVNDIDQTVNDTMRKNYDNAYNTFNGTLAFADQKADDQRKLWDAIIDFAMMALPMFGSEKVGSLANAIETVNGKIGAAKGMVNTLSAFGTSAMSAVDPNTAGMRIPAAVGQGAQAPGGPAAPSAGAPGTASIAIPKPSEAAGRKPTGKAENAVVGLELVDRLRTDVTRLPGGLGVLHDFAMEATKLQGRMDLFIETGKVREDWTASRFTEAVGVLDNLQLAANEIKQYSEKVRDQFKAMAEELKSKVLTPDDIEKELWLNWMGSIPDENFLISSGVLDNDKIEARLTYHKLIGPGSLLGVDFEGWTSDEDTMKAKSSAKYHQRLKSVVGHIGTAHTALTPNGTVSFPELAGISDVPGTMSSGLVKASAFISDVASDEIYIPEGTQVSATAVVGTGGEFYLTVVPVEQKSFEDLMGEKKQAEEERKSFDQLAGNKGGSAPPPEWNPDTSKL